MPSITDFQSSIPVGTQFSPDLIDLKSFLDAAVRHSGDRGALEAAVVAKPVRISPYKRPPTKRMRSLPIEAAVQYGLLEKDSLDATALARQLARLSGLELHEKFATHILTHLGGLRVVEAAEEMHLEGRRVNGDALARYLTASGFPVVEHNTAINSLRLWLARAGLFPRSGRVANAWRPDAAVKEKLLGLDDHTIGVLTNLAPQQIAFTLSLARLGPAVGQKFAASEVRDLAETTHGVQIGRGSLPNEVLRPLEDAGLIMYSTRGTSGGKTSQLEVTSNFNTDVLVPFLENTIKDLDPTTASYFRARPTDIARDLVSKDKYRAGMALEAYTVYVMRLLGLRFIGWRRRAQETGYAEVDVVMAGLYGDLPTTWQIQCKNTPSKRITLEDVAREVGLLPLTKATHIMLIANSEFTTDARRYADEIMLSTSATIFLLDATDFQAILAKPESLGRIWRAQGRHIRDVKARAPGWSGIKKPGTHT